MIYDFGCLGKTDFATLFSALPGTLSILAIFAGLAVIGRVANHSGRFQAYDIYTGWGLVAAIMTLAGVCSTFALPLISFAVFIAIAAAAFPALRSGYFAAPFWVLAIFPGLLFLTAINVTGIAKWDDFSHWVPNALYLFDHNSLPQLSLPKPHSVWPSYPYALPFLTYLASWLAGGFLAQGGAMISFLLLVSFASLLPEISAPTNNKQPLSLSSIGKAGFGLAFVTLANPGFNASFSITSQADTSTAVLTGAIGLLLWRSVTMLREKDKAASVALTVPMICAALALILLKQSNLSLLGLLTISFLVVAVKNRVLKPALTQAACMLVPALIARAIWSHYADVNMADNVFAMRPIMEWRFDLIPAVLQAMGEEMLKKNGLTLLMGGMAIYGVTGIFRPATPRRDFALMVGIVYFGYIAFLLVSYIGAHFFEVEIRRATSFYRYCTHTSLLGMAALWMVLPSLKESLTKKMRGWQMPQFTQTQMGRAAGVLFLIFLLPIIYLIHSTWIVPEAGPHICAIRNFARQMAVTLPDHAKIVTMEPETDVLFTFITDMQFGFEEAQTKRDLRVGWYIDRGRANFDRAKMPSYIKQIEDDKAVTTIVVPQAEQIPLKVMGYDNAAGPLVLEREGKSWKKLDIQASP